MRTCHKRCLSDDGESFEGMEVSEKEEGETPSNKRQRESDYRTMTSLPSNSSGYHDMNFPLLDESGVAALVKVSVSLVCVSGVVVWTFVEGMFTCCRCMEILTCTK